jgi:hypothetical protein
VLLVIGFILLILYTCVLNLLSCVFCFIWPGILYVTAGFLTLLTMRIERILLVLLLLCLYFVFFFPEFGLGYIECCLYCFW